jgi:Sporulation and spore germination/Immunoglobulin-like domain of bacterial spore germination
VTRRRLITIASGVAALGAALGLLATACSARDRTSAAPPARQVATLAMRPPDAGPTERMAEERAVERAVDQPATRIPRRTPMGLTVYYLSQEGGVRYLSPERHELLAAPTPREATTAAVSELLTGTPGSIGSTRPFPAGTRLLDLRVAGSTATVNLSAKALGASAGDGYPVQALVWTATQVPGVSRVVVQVEGRTDGTVAGSAVSRLLGVGAGGRELVRDQRVRIAPVQLDQPASETAIEGVRVVIKGQARVAGGMVGLRMRDRSGTVVSQGYAVLGATPPAWGAFSGALTFAPPAKPQLWTVEAFEVDPASAAITYRVAVPVWVGR